MKRIVMIAGAVVIAGGVSTAATAAAYAASTPSPGPSTTSAPDGPGRPHILRFSAGAPPTSQMLYGEGVAKTDKGAIERHDWQNGQVTAVSGTSMTVRSSDGTSWTWTLGKDTRVVKTDKNGAPSGGTVSGIKVGDKVMVSGLRDGSTRTAAAIADPPPDPARMLRKVAPPKDLKKLKDLKDLKNPPGNVRKVLPRLRGGVPGMGFFATDPSGASTGASTDTSTGAGPATAAYPAGPAA